MSRAFYVTNTPHSLRFLNSIYQSLVRLHYGGKVHPGVSDIPYSIITMYTRCITKREVSYLSRKVKRRSCESERIIHLNATIANYEVISRPSFNLWTVRETRTLIRDETISKSAASIRLHLNFRLHVSCIEEIDCSDVATAWNDFTVSISASSAISRASSFLGYLMLAVNTLRRRADDNAYVRSLIFIKSEVTRAPLFGFVTQLTLYGFNRFSPW